MPHLADGVVDTEIDRELLNQPEPKAAAAARQQVTKANFRNISGDCPEAPKRNEPKSTQEVICRKHEAVLCLSRKHSAILVTSSRVSANIVRRPEEAKVVNGNAPARSSTT